MLENKDKANMPSVLYYVPNRNEKAIDKYVSCLPIAWGIFNAMRRLRNVVEKKFAAFKRSFNHAVKVTNKIELPVCIGGRLPLIFICLF